MSISSMTNVAVSRRKDDLGRNRAPRNARETARETGEKEKTESASSAALKAIVTYIPTEVITVYVAVLAALRGEDIVEGLRDERFTARTVIDLGPQEGAFWFFLVATPLIVWMSYAGKVKTGGKKLPLTPKTWPWWEMIAATVAFVAWASALPETPWVDYEWFTPALGTVFVLLASTFLGLAAPIFQRPLKG